MKAYTYYLILLIGCCWLGCNDSEIPSSKKLPSTDSIIAHPVPMSNSSVPEKSAKKGLDKVLVDSSFRFPYLLDLPDKTVKLSHKLVEISGLGMSNGNDQFCAVQDEKGVIYMLDRNNGEIVSKIPFWKSGDYEGIEMIGNDIYVVKSSGTIFKVQDAGEENQKVSKYNTFLKRENDVEGLCYDAKNNRLLLACKGRPATGESLEAFRFRKCIYGYDLTSNLLDSMPAYTVNLDQIQDYLQTRRLAKELNKLIDFFTPDQNNLTFNPSAIAIHPTSGNIYLTSSVGKVLIVLDENNKILYIEKLNKKLHPQPEGLTFDQSGNLYISNEGKESKARIHRFDSQIPIPE